MSVYTRTTVTASQDVYCLYKCEQCQEINLEKLKVKGYGQYTDRGTSFSRKKAEAQMAERSSQANDVALEGLGMSIAKMESGVDGTWLRENKFQCKCRKCGKSPYWTYPQLSLFNTIGVVSTIIVLFLSSKLGWGISALICAFVWGARFFYSNICDNKLEKQTPPVFATSLDSLREKKNQYPDYKDYIL